MNTQRNIVFESLTVRGPVLSLRSSTGFRKVRPQSAISPRITRITQISSENPQSAIRNPKSVIGFTVIEMLVIVAIIGLLIGILLPAMNYFIVAGREAKVRAAIHMIDGACKYYFNDFDDYPPSREDSEYSGWTGGELIVLFLTGYGPDPDPKGVPGGAFDVDDGKEGYGFRVVPRGRVYGPYNGVEKLAIRDVSGDGRPEFVDVFGRYDGNSILYYRFGGSGYVSGHNTGNPPSLDSQYAKNAAGEYYRTDFILISRGLNVAWNEPSDPESDDITNFFSH